MEYQLLTLAIADDHTLFRKGVLEIFKAFPEITVIADANNGLELIEKIENNLPDVVILDLEMPEMDGIATSRFMLSKHPEVKILIVSMYGEESLVEKLVSEGVHGYLLKNSEPDEVRIALQTLIRGENYYSKEVQKSSFF
jgi:DNA-binding NarL/FixJ family response regulator